MNRKSMKAVATAVALAGVMAVGASAASSNVVGYIEAEVPGGLSLMSVPFQKAGGGLQTLDGVFGDKLPDGSEVFVYVSGVGYTTYTYYEGFGWYLGDDEAGTTELDRGTGFWVRNNSGTAVSLSLVGEVPVADTDVQLPTGVALVSFGFPVDEALGEVTGLSPLDGDEIFVFVGGTYVTHTYYEGFGWYCGDDPSTLTFEPGKAYWYRRNGATVVWTQSLPDSVEL